MTIKLKDRLKELRKERGQSAVNLATLTGKAESTVRTWETGKSFPDADTLSKLADNFDVSVDWLLGRTTYRNQKHSDEYHLKFIDLTYRRQIERLHKLFIDICDKYQRDDDISGLVLKWFIDATEKCVMSFDKLLSEVNGDNSLTLINKRFNEILGTINKLSLDIASHYLKKGRGVGNYATRKNTRVNTKKS